MTFKNASPFEDKQESISSTQDWNVAIAHSTKIENHFAQISQSDRNIHTQQPGVFPRAKESTPNKPAKMSKDRAQSLATRLKQTALVTSIVAFGLFGALIAPQIQATLTKSSATTSKTTSTSTTTPATSSGSFFDQSQSGGYSIGTSNSASSNSGTSQSTTPGTSTSVS